MRVVNIKVDEARLRNISPKLSDTESISRWLQRQVDEMIEDLSVPHSQSPNAHSPEEMHAILSERIRRAELGQESPVPNKAVFDAIKDKYGF